MTKTAIFRVIKGGQVFHEGDNFMSASCAYSRAIKKSAEPVTLFHNGKIRSEYFPKQAA